MSEQDIQKDKYVLINLIEAEYDMLPGEFMANTNSRRQEYMFGRRMLYVILKERHPKLTLDKIGRVCGKRHATVLNAIEKHRIEHSGYPKYGKAFDNVYFKFNTAIREEILKGTKETLTMELSREYRKRLDCETKIAELEQELKELDHIKPNQK